MCDYTICRLLNVLYSSYYTIPVTIGALEIPVLRYSEPYGKVYARNSDLHEIPNATIPKLRIQCSRNSVQVAHGIPTDTATGSHGVSNMVLSQIKSVVTNLPKAP